MSRYSGMFHGDDTETTASDHLKDPGHIVILLGYCAPLFFLSIAVINLSIGRVFLPYDRYPGDSFDGLSQSYTDAWRVYGVVTMKIGFAAAFFSWYALANYERTERWAQVVLLISIIIVALGVIATSIGYF